MIRFYKMGSGLLLISILSGCSALKTLDEALPDNRVDYKKSSTTSPLEVPPDLLKDSIKDELAIPEAINPPKETSLSDYNKEQADSKKSLSTGKSQVLPQLAPVQYYHAGDTQWLVLPGEPGTVWERIKAFWTDQGFSLTQEDSRTGIMETEWKENRANLPQSGLRKLVGQVLDEVVYDSSTRDKFRVRLERGHETGTTEVYLTHRGAEEVSQGDNFVWQNRPSDPTLEAEMLKRLMVFVGVPAEQAQTQVANAPVPRADLQRTAAGQVSLLVREDFANAWQRTGIALDRLGFSIEDRDRAKGIYFVRPTHVTLAAPEKQGFFSRLFGSNDDTAKNQEYLIKLTSDQAISRVLVMDKQEQIDNGPVAEKILTLLQEQLK